MEIRRINRRIIQLPRREEEEDAQVKRSMHVVGDGHPNRHTGGNQKDVL